MLNEHLTRSILGQWAIMEK